MIFPKFLKKGDLIGVTAPSYGITDPVEQKRFKNGVKNLGERGYSVKFTDNVFTADETGLSSDAKTRAGQFMELVTDGDVSAIISAAGGNFLMEMLPFVDFDAVKKNPKWIQGYSDNTALLYAVTTICDVATVYGNHFGDFGMETWERPVESALGVLEGKVRVQQSFDFYEDEWRKRETGLEGYAKDKPVKWVNARGEDEIKISGRLIGGCFDIIAMAIAGTKFDGTLDFIERYGSDGICWYLESFDINVEEMVLHLWRLKEAGYFRHASGFIFGRPLFKNAGVEMTYEQAIMRVLADLDVPVIFDADIGHKGPQFSMVNGALCDIVSCGGRGSVTLRF